jgi:hypothetical protein
VQLDPGLARFSQDDAALTGFCVRKLQIQLSLVAALSLDCQRLAVRQPVDAGEVDIRVAAQVDPSNRSAASEI